MKKIRVCTLGSRERLEWRRYVDRPTHRGDPEFLWSEPPRDEHVHDER